MMYQLIPYRVLTAHDVGDLLSGRSTTCTVIIGRLAFVGGSVVSALAFLGSIRRWMLVFPIPSSSLLACV